MDVIRGNRSEESDHRMKVSDGTLHGVIHKVSHTHFQALAKVRIDKAA